MKFRCLKYYLYYFYFRGIAILFSENTIITLISAHNDYIFLSRKTAKRVYI